MRRCGCFPNASSSCFPFGIDLWTRRNLALWAMAASGPVHAVAAMSSLKSIPNRRWCIFAIVIIARRTLDLLFRLRYGFLGKYVWFSMHYLAFLHLLSGISLYHVDKIWGCRFFLYLVKSIDMSCRVSKCWSPLIQILHFQVCLQYRFEDSIEESSSQTTFRLYISQYQTRTKHLTKPHSP